MHNQEVINSRKYLEILMRISDGFTDAIKKTAKSEADTKWIEDFLVRSKRERLQDPRKYMLHLAHQIVLNEAEYRECCERIREVKTEQYSDDRDFNEDCELFLNQTPWRRLLSLKQHSADVKSHLKREKRHNDTIEIMRNRMCILTTSQNQRLHHLYFNCDDVPRVTKREDLILIPELEDTFPEAVKLCAGLFLSPTTI